MPSNEKFLKEVGQRIMERRKKLNMTQEALAEKGDVSPQYVSYAEAGKRAIRPENLLSIASALDVSTDYLLTGNVVNKDLLILSDKMEGLPQSQIQVIAAIVEELCLLFQRGTN